MNQNQSIINKSESSTKLFGFHIIVNRKAANGISPYRLADNTGNSIEQVNQYLDSLATRGLSDKTVRIYAYDLLNFWTWLAQAKINPLRLADITRNSLLEYVRYQRQSTSTISAVTINHRLIVVKCLYQYHFDRPIPINLNSAKKPSTYFAQRNGYRIGWMYPIRAKQLSTRVKTPYRVIVPLTYYEISGFFESLKTWRDIAITGFMLFCGLRSMEIINLKSDDIGITEGQVLIHGKGDKQRIVPLPKDLIMVIDRYVNLERPKTNSPYLFVVLKGPHRGLSLSYWADRKSVV